LLVADKCAQEPARGFLKPIPFALTDQMVRIIREQTEDGEGGKAFLTQQEGGIFFTAVGVADRTSVDLDSRYFLHVERHRQFVG
jgi:hypothetical protein